MTKVQKQNNNFQNNILTTRYKEDYHDSLVSTLLFTYFK